MANESEPVTRELRNIPGRPRGSRTGSVIATTALTTVGLGMVVGLPLVASLKDTDTLVAPPGSTKTLEPSLSPSTSPSIRPTIPVFPPSPFGRSADPEPTNSAASPGSFCESQQSPIEGIFDRNTGVHTLPATYEHQSIAVVTPERSGVQQLRWRLPRQEAWISLDPGETGIVVRTGVDIEVDTGDNRAVWFKMCEESTDASEKEIPSRVDDVFKNFGFGYVNVYSITEDGYVIQEVRQGESYSPDIPSTFVPF